MQTRPLPQHPRGMSPKKRWGEKTSFTAEALQMGRRQPRGVGSGGARKEWEVAAQHRKAGGGTDRERQPLRSWKSTQEGDPGRNPVSWKRLLEGGSPDPGRGIIRMQVRQDGSFCRML